MEIIAIFIFLTLAQSAPPPKPEIYEVRENIKTGQLYIDRGQSENDKNKKDSQLLELLRHYYKPRNYDESSDSVAKKVIERLRYIQNNDDDINERSNLIFVKDDKSLYNEYIDTEENTNGFVDETRGEPHYRPESNFARNKQVFH